MTLTKEIYIKDISESKDSEKGIIVFEEQYCCDALLEYITKEQKRKGAEEMSKDFLDPVYILDKYLKNKWNNNRPLTKQEAYQKRLEFIRYKKLIERIMKEFGMTKYKESEYVPKITGRANNWLVVDGNNYKTYFPTNDKIERKIPQIDIAKNPSKKQLGMAEFNHVFECLKKYVETDKLY